MPKVSVRLFAGLREMIGERDIEVELPVGANVDALKARVGEQYPMVQAMLTALVCAVEEEYVDGEHTLRDGDRVALIPPVSGG